ncbi:DUF707 domain-containing protein [Oryzifoliimicrobium ureilyticus]|uniref:DUF707 domain-containing protein n=1 Tax=Oryzifoliimicrobium ureilyticus TaxID=3113724 RepID=UPI00307623B8
MNMLASMNANPIDELINGLVEAPALRRETLDGSFWHLVSLNRGELSPFFVLAPESLIGNFFDPTVDCWQVVNGRLCFSDQNGIPSVVFNVANMDGDKPKVLAGRGRIGGVSDIYLLIAADHPAHPLFQPGATANAGIQFLEQPSDGPRRPNLVVVPANSKSLHPHWFEGLQEDTRNWDLCVGYYGQEMPIVSSPFEYLVHLPKRKKFQLLSDLFFEASPLWNYDYIWLPDDDLLCNGIDVNRLFHLVRKFGLDLSQPSLVDGPNSFPNHPITLQRPASILRYEGFIEIMCPLFSQRALKICAGSMKDVESGYGLDHLWPSFLGRPFSRMGIIDAVAVAHTRPIGATYNVGAAIAEQAALFRSYDYTPLQFDGVR